MAWSNTKIAVVTVATFLLLIGGMAVIVVLLYYWRQRPSAGSLPAEQAIVSPVSRVAEVLPKITPGQGGVENAVPGWKTFSSGKVDGEHDPSAPPGGTGCYGIAWGVQGYNKTVLVFQTKQVITFRPGGWYVQVRVPEEARFSPEDVGQILADWLDKTYQTGPLQVVVLQ